MCSGHIRSAVVTKQLPNIIECSRNVGGLDESTEYLLSKVSCEKYARNTTVRVSEQA